MSYPVIKRTTNDSFDVNETMEFMQFIYFDAVLFIFWGLLEKYMTDCKINCQGRYLAHKLEFQQMYFSDYFIYISCIFTFFRQSQLLFSLRFFNTRSWRYWSHHIWSKFENLKTIVNKFSRNPCVHKNKNSLKTTTFYINHICILWTSYNHSIIWSCTSDMLLQYFHIK